MVVKERISRDPDMPKIKFTSNKHECCCDAQRSTIVSAVPVNVLWKGVSAFRQPDYGRTPSPYYI